jgi:hypothetical protein
VTCVLKMSLTGGGGGRYVTRTCFCYKRSRTNLQSEVVHFRPFANGEVRVLLEKLVVAKLVTELLA